MVDCNVCKVNKYFCNVSVYYSKFMIRYKYLFHNQALKSKSRSYLLSYLQLNDLQNIQWHDAKIYTIYISTCTSYFSQKVQESCCLHIATWFSIKDVYAPYFCKLKKQYSLLLSLSFPTRLQFLPKYLPWIN